jgi:hypothetical protein
VLQSMQAHMPHCIIEQHRSCQNQITAPCHIVAGTGAVTTAPAAVQPSQSSQLAPSLSQ